MRNYLDHKDEVRYVDGLLANRLNEDDIVCSSYPGVGIPIGEKVYEWLVEKF